MCLKSGLSTFIFALIVLGNISWKSEVHALKLQPQDLSSLHEIIMYWEKTTTTGSITLPPVPFNGTEYTPILTKNLKGSEVGVLLSEKKVFEKSTTVTRTLINDASKCVCKYTLTVDGFNEDGEERTFISNEYELTRSYEKAFLVCGIPNIGNRPSMSLSISNEKEQRNILATVVNLPAWAGSREGKQLVFKTEDLKDFNLSKATVTADNIEYKLADEIGLAVLQPQTLEVQAVLAFPSNVLNI